MKIGIPVDKKDKGTNGCISFGRAPYFSGISDMERIINTAAKSGVI